MNPNQDITTKIVGDNVEITSKRTVPKDDYTLQKMNELASAKANLATQQARVNALQAEVDSLNA